MTARTGVSLIVEDAAWRKAGIDLPRLRAAARLALVRGLNHPSPNPKQPQTLCHAHQLCILLADDARLRELNKRFRGKDAPTNVLSFPAAGQGFYLGDVAIALGCAAREAASSGIPLLAHTLHLTVHGVLHLLGYDHVKAREARTMERLEIAILTELGIPSPYARAAAAE